jgi:alpha-amylase
MWVPERVWEQGLTAAIAEAGIDYTLLDDYHFRRTGLVDDQLHGYYLTEDDGRLLKVFPICERLRYLIPFQEPHETYSFLKNLAATDPGCTVVFADDGEKFGSWPDTQEPVYAGGWLRRFCDMLAANRDWIETSSLGQAVDTRLPLGKVYLSDSSYREMTEWVLPPARFQAYMAASQHLAASPHESDLRPFMSAGGFWRNFRAKYAESDEMYTRMLGLSRRLERATGLGDDELLEVAERALHQGQCNCPYWHGAFGGLYLPHLRNAIYQQLIAAHNALDEALGQTGPRIEAEVGDFNLDARQEVKLENDRLIAWIRPAQGGHIYELDTRQALVNLLATLDRRPEPYHDTIRAAARGQSISDGRASITERVILKQTGLERMLTYDRHPRKALVDHIFAPDLSLDALLAGGDVEQGDFATGAYLATVQRHGTWAELVLERPGRALGHLIRIRKRIRIEAGAPRLDVAYELTELPVGVPLVFGVELNLAGMAGHADDRYLEATTGRRLGLLDTRLDLKQADGLSIRDDWQGLAIDLSWSEPADLWCFPIETVSQSEGGFEGVYQSTAVLPRWAITADASRRFEVALSWTIDDSRAGARELLATSRGQAAQVILGD